MTTRTFPPSTGRLAAISLSAFCTDEGVTADGVHYRCLPREKVWDAMKLGWIAMERNCGARDGVPVGLFAWLCDCEVRVPA